MVQISCENIELLQNEDFAKAIYSNSAHNLQAQVKLEKDYGQEMGRFATMQRKILPKANKKLPTWHKHQCFFTPKSYEQSTSEELARAKASLFKGGKRLLSLTGGLGVDDWALSSTYKEVISLDTDASLNKIVENNYQKLGLKSVSRLTTSAEFYLKNNALHFDTYYVDPDRRADSGTKGLNAEVFSPNILSLIKEYPQISMDLWIKLSPATDLTWIRKNIGPNTDIYILEKDAEVKEILCHVWPKGTALLEILIVQSKMQKINETSNPSGKEADCDVLWEPSAALIKSGFANQNSYAGLMATNANFTLFTGKKVLPKIYGRTWKILAQGTDGIKQLKKNLLRLGIESAGVTCKSYPIKPHDLMKKLKLRESSQHQIYFTENNGKKRWFVVARI